MMCLSQNCVIITLNAIWHYCVEKEKKKKLCRLEHSLSFLKEEETCSVFVYHLCFVVKALVHD